MIDFGKIFGPSIQSSVEKEVVKEYNRHRPLGPQKYACYAPFKNLYFGHYGKVVACCYNRENVLGTYPQQSIKQIWQGERANQLRDHLKAYNFSQGCGNCESQLHAKNFDGTKAKQYDESRMNKNLYPSVMEFELSNTCNLECMMCNGDFSSLIRKNRENREELPIPYNDEFVTQLEEFIPHLEEVKFYGGEPFLIDIYFKIWEKIIQINPSIRISVQTNGTILHKRVKDILQHSNFHITVSLDSLRKDNYPKIRVNADLGRVLENVNYFNSYHKTRDTFFGISVCIMQQNWFEAPDFIRFSNELDIPVYFHTVWMPKHATLLQLPSKKLKEIHDTLSSYLDEFPENTLNEKKNKRHYRNFLGQIYEWRLLSERDEQLHSTDTLEKLIDFVVKQTLQRRDIDEVIKRTKAVKIADNLRLLASNLPIEENLTRQLMSLNSLQDQKFNNLLDSIETVSVDQARQHLILNKTP